LSSVLITEIEKTLSAFSLENVLDEYEDGWGGCIDTFYVDVVDDPFWADLVKLGLFRPRLKMKTFFLFQ